MKLSKDLERRCLELSQPVKKTITIKQRMARNKFGEGALKEPLEKNKGRNLVMDALFLSHDLPVPIYEYQFALHLGRNWAFDFLLDGWLAIEKDGMVHRIRDKFIRDLEKLNYAVLLGYTVLRFTNEQIKDGSAFAFIKRVYKGEEE